MMRDTLPDARAERLKALSRLTPAERLEKALDMSDFVRDLVRKGHADRSRDSAASPSMDDPLR